MRPVDRSPIMAVAWRDSGSKSWKMVRAAILPLKHQNGINAFSVGICVAKCFTKYLSNHARCRVGFKRPSVRKHVLRVQLSRDRWRHMTQKRSSLWLQNHWGTISRKMCKMDIGSSWSPIGSHISRVQWSRDWWRHVSPKGQRRDS